MSQITNIHGHEVLYDGLTNTVKILKVHESPKCAAWKQTFSRIVFN